MVDTAVVVTIAELATVVTAATGGLVVDTAVVVVAAVTVPGAVVEVSYRGLMFPPTLVLVFLLRRTMFRGTAAEMSAEG